MKRRDFVKGAGVATLGAGMVPFLRSLPAEAAGKNGTLVVVQGNTINSLDIHRLGSNRPSYMASVNIYDRLVAFGTKKLADGSMSYDYTKIVPELAESWETSADGLTITFKLRKDATFHDGTKVTAEDVRWSFERAISVKGFPPVQMKAGGMESKDQFIAVDDETFVLKLKEKSKLTMPDLAVPVPFVINKKAALKHATKDDPWAHEYLYKNPQGGGAFKVARWTPGQQLIYERFDDWKNGELPGVKRVIVREVPSQATRRALIERGDVHMSYNIPAKDAKDLKAAGKLNVVGTPIENCFHSIGLNQIFEPFKDVKVRQAVAYAIPYEEIFQNAAYGRGVRMFGAKSFKPETSAWPQAFPYNTDYDKAKDLLAQTAYKDGFEVPLSINLGLASWTEPTALLVQEGLAKIGIKTPINKIPGSKWRTFALVKKNLPLHLENFGGWLNYTDYYFFWCYVTGRFFNSYRYSNAEVDKIVDDILFKPTTAPDYEEKAKRLVEIAFHDVPRIGLWQPTVEVAMRRDVEGYEYNFHRQLDARSLSL